MGLNFKAAMSIFSVEYFQNVLAMFIRCVESALSVAIVQTGLILRVAQQVVVIGAASRTILDLASGCL